MKKSFLIIVLLLVSPLWLLAQSVVTTDSISHISDSLRTLQATQIISGASNFFGIAAIPTWLQTLLISILTLLPSMQYVLKRVPTNESVKIQGIIGKILDILTFFQKDRNISGGTHK